MLLDHTTGEYTGLDISEEMLRHIPGDATQITGSLLNIPNRDQFYDFGFGVETLEHALNIPLAIREMARVIKKGGTLLIIDKNREKQGKLKISEWEQWLTKSEVTKLLEDEGFTVTIKNNTIWGWDVDYLNYSFSSIIILFNFSTNTLSCSVFE